MEQFYKLENAFFSRTFEVTKYSLRTISLRNLLSGTEYVRKPVWEFKFAINDKLVQSGDESGASGSVEFDDKEEKRFVFEKMKSGMDRVDFTFRNSSFLVTVSYRISQKIPGYRKYLTFQNTGEEVALSQIDFENLCFCPGPFSECDFYRGHEDIPENICFALSGNEDIVRCHNPRLNEGWILGTSAPGVLRHILVYPNWGRIVNGYNRSSAPFVKYMRKGETFQTDSSLLAFYRGLRNDPQTISGFRDLVRWNLPELPRTEGCMYCTWLPFLKDIHEQMLLNLIDKAAGLGFRYFVLDDGWFTDNDHEVDQSKFPNGLEPIVQRCVSKGLILGLWYNIGTDYGIRYPNQKWMAVRGDGKINRSGEDYENSRNVMCFGSEYREYILKKLDSLCRQYGVGYFKLDFSSVASPYDLLAWGCHSTTHEHHRNWNDSFIAMYRGMLYVRKELKKCHPDLIIDFSFEAFGTSSPNIAALQYAELHHVSNSSGNNPEFQDITRIRKNFYRWLNKLPPERILNGLLTMQNDQAAEYFLTGLAGAPLFAGDLHSLPSDVEHRIQLFAKAFNQVVVDGPLTEFEVVINDELLDGFIRYSKKRRGIFCLFNRKLEPATFRLSRNFQAVNVEDGTRKLVIRSRTCAMFTF